MRTVYKILIRISLLIVTFFVINEIYKRFFYEQDLQEHASVINLVRETEPNTEILYFGESSNSTFGKNDYDTRKISEMLGDFYPTMLVDDVTIPASHAGIYQKLLRLFPQDNSIKTVVITVNLRSFGYDWIYSGLESSHQKSLVLLKPLPPLVNRFLLAFKAYFKMSDKQRLDLIKKKWKNEEFDTINGFRYLSVYEWDRGMALEGIRNDQGKYDKKLTELACHYIKSYAFNLDTLNNPRIISLDKIVKLSREQGWRLVFNILAENTETAKELVGSQLTGLMRENADKIINYYSHRGVIVVDNLELIAGEHYIDQDWTTEHYDEKGRKQIARNLAKSLQKVHHDAFVYLDEADYLLPSTFVNDCDSPGNWGQHQTISGEKYYSFPKASKVSKPNPYSITFEIPLDRIAESKRNAVDIAFQAYVTGNSETPLPKLVIDITDENGSQHWNAFDLRVENTPKGNWVKQSFIFPFKELNYYPREIKIYVFNEYESPVFVDDMTISFN